MKRMKCKFTVEEIEEKTKQMYPLLEQKEINYHVQHIEDNDWLKVTNDEDQLEITIREQVEDLLNQ